MLWGGAFAPRSLHRPRLLDTPGVRHVGPLCDSPWRALSRERPRCDEANGQLPGLGKFSPVPPQSGPTETVAGRSERCPHDMRQLGESSPLLCPGSARYRLMIAHSSILARRSLSTQPIPRASEWSHLQHLPSQKFAVWCCIDPLNLRRLFLRCLVPFAPFHSPSAVGLVPPLRGFRALGLERYRTGWNQMFDVLKKQGIGISVHFIPLHLHPYYRDNYGYFPKDFPMASSVFERIISLPIYPKMAEVDIQYVIEVVATLIKAHRR